MEQLQAETTRVLEAMHGSVAVVVGGQEARTLSEQAPRGSRVAVSSRRIRSLR